MSALTYKGIRIDVSTTRCMSRQGPDHSGVMHWTLDVSGGARGQGLNAGAVEQKLLEPGGSLEYRPHHSASVQTAESATPRRANAREIAGSDEVSVDFEVSFDVKVDEAALAHAP